MATSARAQTTVQARVQAPARANEPHTQIKASRATRPPSLDGRLTDEVWSSAEPTTGFLQTDPDEGKPATEDTEIRVLYDDQAIYIGARMFDGDPKQISNRMSTRDGDADADWIAIYLDTIHDHLTGVQFRVTASNVQRDTVVYNDTWQDGSWDAVWESAVSLDDRGWSAEFRIPLSPLRFPAADQQTWGVNVQRFVRRKNETTWLELVRKNESGLASRMGHLEGLNGLRPRRHVELLPYTGGRNEFVSPAAGNPFNDGSRPFGSAGMDVKWGITSNLTLDGSFNPDFGQVEVDPAVVNLTAFETFFDEKRPFFLEGSQIFNNYGYQGSNDFWGFNSSSLLTITTGPQFSHSYGLSQYVRSITDATAANTYGGRYVFGAIDQTQLTLPTRVNVILTPRISIRLYAQPLLVSGDYGNFKELALPRTFDFLEYGTAGSSLAYDAATSTYTVDPDAGGDAAPFTFSNPDFSFKSLRVNAVFRWGSSRARRSTASGRGSSRTSRRRGRSPSAATPPRSSPPAATMSSW